MHLPDFCPEQITREHLDLPAQRCWLTWQQSPCIDMIYGKFLLLSTGYANLPQTVICAVSDSRFNADTQRYHLLPVTPILNSLTRPCSFLAIQSGSAAALQLLPNSKTQTSQLRLTHTALKWSMLYLLAQTPHLQPAAPEAALPTTWNFSSFLSSHRTWCLACCALSSLPPENQNNSASRQVTTSRRVTTQLALEMSKASSHFWDYHIVWEIDFHT